ncbi:hypothetical protein [Lutibacter sp.]|uniref:hypothetical protein n=1 Tax=Lutibacter sp. TaxID=1925666 RepID=UPI0035624831
MHKKIEAELVSLAHSILEQKNNNILVLHKKAQAIYEKLTVLKFVESNLEGTLKDEELNIEEKNEDVEVTVQSITEVEKEKEGKEPLTETQVEEIFSVKETMTKNDMKEIPSIQPNLDEEFKDAISADVATNLFEKATKESPTVDEAPTSGSRSINDALFKSNLQIGLNDRIAFVKYLFDGSQEDFNRVLSQLNSFKTEKETKDFLFNLVKPDYDWSGKEEYEERLINLIERKFM